MKKYLKICWLGFLTWIIPFAVSFLFYSKEGKPLIDLWLSKSIMVVVGNTTGVLLLLHYFSKIKSQYFHEGVNVGLIWLAINIVLDLLILVPMSKMTLLDYFFQIGIRYLLIPVMSIAMGYSADMVINQLKKFTN